MERVAIRPVSLKDLERLVELANNRRISDNLTDDFPHPYTREDGETFIESASQQKPIHRFAITADGKYVGNIGLHPQSDIYAKSAEIGYFVGEPYWGRGIISEAIRLIVKYGFEELDYIRIYAKVFEHNTPSMKALEKNGFVKEGVSRKAIVKNDVVMDDHQYAIINPNY